MGILDDEKVLIDELDDNPRRVVLDFIDANYLGEVCVSETVNSDGKYEACSLGDVSVSSFHLESLTNDMFVWTTVCGSFECRNCVRLKSLVGAPQIVGQDFRCDGCISLCSLEGAPSKVLGEFICCGCKGLKREEIRLYKKSLIRNIPNYFSIKRAMKNFDELSSATIGKPRWGGDKSTIGPYASCKNGLHASIAAYNAESNSCGNALKEYLDGRGLSILHQYAEYLNDED